MVMKLQVLLGWLTATTTTTTTLPASASILVASSSFSSLPSTSSSSLPLSSLPASSPSTTPPSSSSSLSASSSTPSPSPSLSSPSSSSLSSSSSSASTTTSSASTLSSPLSQSSSSPLSPSSSSSLPTSPSPSPSSSSPPSSLSPSSFTSSVPSSGWTSSGRLKSTAAAATSAVQHDQGDYSDRDDQGDYSDRQYDQGDYSDQDDQGDYSDRGDQGDYSDRDDQGDYSDRQHDQGDYSDRDDQGDYSDRQHDQGDYSDRDDQETSTTPEEEAGRAPHLGHTDTSVTVHLGATAALDCLVHDLLDEPVSWLRRVGDVLELITWDTHTYASDRRYSLVQESGDRWHRWQLVIRDAQLEDQGQYRCQVATQPPLLLSATLTVIEPRARVVDERGQEVREKHYNSGSMIELKCVIDQVPFPHGPVTWRRGPTTLSFNTSRGGISLKGQPAWGFIRSRLYVAEATPADSGVYSCWYMNATSDTVTVHVLAGENSAAMQHDASPEASTSGSPPRWNLFAHTCHLSLLVAICVVTLTTT